MNKLMTIVMVITLASGASNVVATELIDAVKVGDIARIKELKKQRVDLNECDKSGQTALMHAVKLGRFDLVQELYWYDLIPIHDLVLGDGWDVRYRGDLNIQDNKGKTALMYAVERDDIKIVRSLLIHDAIRSIKAHNGSTAYTLALRRGNMRILSLLIWRPRGGSWLF